jgi:heme/copper-type cytochrome/quinol oxidase subunit 4
MDAKDLAALLLKIAGLVILGHALFQVPYFFPLEEISAGKFSFADAVMSAVYYITLPLVVGALLWFFPATISNKIVSGKKLSDSGFGVRQFEQVALTLIGVWLVAYGIADLISSLVWIAQVEKQFNTLPPRAYAATLAAVAKVIIGCAIAIGSGGVSRLLRRLGGGDG